MGLKVGGTFFNNNKNLSLSTTIYQTGQTMYHIPDRANYHIPDRANYHIPDRANYHTPDRANYHIPDRANYHTPGRRQDEGGKYNSEYILPRKDKYCQGENELFRSINEIRSNCIPLKVPSPKCNVHMNT